MNKQMTLLELANALGISRKTVEREIKRGNIKAVKANPFGGITSPLVIPAAEVKRVLKLREKGLGKK
jgi:excisionase family DNA binding protein